MITYDVCFGFAFDMPGGSIATFRSKKEALALAVRSSNEPEYWRAPFTIVKVTETDEGWEFENLAMVFQGEVFIRSGRDFGGGV